MPLAWGGPGRWTGFPRDSLASMGLRRQKILSAEIQTLNWHERESPAVNRAHHLRLPTKPPKKAMTRIRVSISRGLWGKRGSGSGLRKGTSHLFQDLSPQLRVKEPNVFHAMWRGGECYYDANSQESQDPYATGGRLFGGGNLRNTV